ncbi:GDP-mannose 4,6-dehydratase [Niallia sp. FSL W8-0635]|uniref:GDP-mannose 4,6-dehydratase n=1 Tax=Niallia sp. FSL W8-0635 TaxID=2975337 RepID=UPI0030F84FE6
MILVTGGAGFIGSSLVDYLLKKDYKVVCIDNFNDYYDPLIKRNNLRNAIKNNNFQLIEGDIRDEELLNNLGQRYKIEMIIHLAAMAGVRPSIEMPLLYQDVNIKGTMNLLEFARQNQINKFIFASSSSVYGNNKKVPFNEKDIVDFAISPYAATKKAGEVLLHTYHHLYDINCIALRFFTVYGPRQRPDLAIHKFTKLILEDKEIPFYGNGTTQRDYTYIDDIIEGIVNSMDYLENKKNVFEIINLGESETISLKKMVQTIADSLQIDAKLKKLPMQLGDVEKTYADINKAKNLINYNPSTNFEKGINQFINWYKSENGYI